MSRTSISVCSAGYEGEAANTCTLCSSDTMYKPFGGDASCEAVPTNSVAMADRVDFGNCQRVL